MKYMLLMSTAPVKGMAPTHEWTPEEMRANGAHMMRIHRELSERGELVGGEALAGPEAAKIVTGDGVGPPVAHRGRYVAEGVRVGSLSQREKVGVRASSRPGCRVPAPQAGVVGVRARRHGASRERGTPSP